MVSDPYAPRQYSLRFQNGELLGDTGYRILSSRDSSRSASSRRAEPLGYGLTGVVYRAVYKETLPRAIKFLCPIKDPKFPFASFIATFQSEISLLASITHTNVAKLLDYGQIERQSRPVHFYAMDYISGTPLDYFWQRPDCDGFTFLIAMDHILQALVHLHDLEPPVLYVDLKEANVLVRTIGSSGSSFTTILIDLGSALVIKPRVETVEQIPLFLPTDDQTHDDLQGWMQKPLPPEEYDTAFPYHDLYAFGQLLRRSLEALEPRLLTDPNIDVGTVAALHTIVHRMEPEHLTDSYYRTARQLQRDWHKLMPSYVSPLGFHEMGVSTPTGSSISLPGIRINLTPRMRAVTDNATFQRLRRIPQLELVSLVYPGAVHSRYQHSLTTYEFMRQILHHLTSNDATFRLMVEREDLEAALLWSLIHDIGHYPLSHMFEDFVERDDFVPAAGPVYDDDHLMSLLAFAKCRSPFPEYETYDNLISGEATSFSALLQQEFRSSTIDALLSMTTKPSTAGQRMLRALMSSPIDIDKLAYLSVDSHAAGVNYGAGIDMHGIFSYLRAPRETDFPAGHSAIIALDGEGITAAESAIFARYAMIRRVYWHHSNRAVMSMVKFVIHHLLINRCDGLPFAEYFSRTFHADQDTALRMLSELFLNAGERGSALNGRTIVNPLSLLLADKRRLYKRIVTIGDGPDDREAEIYNRLAYNSRLYSDLPNLVENISRAVQAALGSRQVSYGEVLVDLPLRRRDRLEGHQGRGSRDSAESTILVYFDKAGSEGQPLYGKGGVSALLDGISQSLDHEKKCRVFVHPDIEDALGPSSGRMRGLRGEVVEVISDFVDA